MHLSKECSSDKIIDEGVYHRMEDHDCTKTFNNGMKITIQGPIATLEVKQGSRKKKRDFIDHLPIRWLGDSEFELESDWLGDKPGLFRNKFKHVVCKGMPGLLENDRH